MKLEKEMEEFKHQQEQQKTKLNLGSRFINLFSFSKDNKVTPSKPFLETKIRESGKRRSISQNFAPDSPDLRVDLEE